MKARASLDEGDSGCGVDGDCGFGCGCDDGGDHVATLVLRPPTPIDSDASDGG